MSEVQLPALGESVTEGTITRWLKNVGDTVAVDEPLVEVSTDKVDTEIPSPVAGVLQEIRAQEDETVEVGAVLAVIGEGAVADSTPAAEPEAEQEKVEEPAAEEQSSPVAQPSEPEPQPTTPVAEPSASPVVEKPAPEAPVVAPPVATTPTPPVEKVESTPPANTDSDAAYITPIVRKLAKDNGVDLAAVKGTGIGGRIRKEDVEAMIGQAPAAPSTTPAPAKEVETSPLRGTTEQMSRLRKVFGLKSRRVDAIISAANQCCGSGRNKNC